MKNEYSIIQDSQGNTKPVTELSALEQAEAFTALKRQDNILNELWAVLHKHCPENIDREHYICISLRAISKYIHTDMNVLLEAYPWLAD